MVPFKTVRENRCLVTATRRSRTSNPMIKSGTAAMTPATQNTSRYLFGMVEPETQEQEGNQWTSHGTERVQSALHAESETQLARPR